MLIRSRLVLPVSQPPIENGALVLAGDRIKAVGSYAELSSRFNEPEIDLGEMILLPGLINAHCHLDLTHLAGQIAPPREFPDWIKALLARKEDWGRSEFAESWMAGAGMLLQNGVTTVANIESVPRLIPEVLPSSPLRVCSFLEITGVRSGRPPGEVMAEAVRWIESGPAHRGFYGLSPHAPYSTLPELLCLAGRTAREKNWRLTVHVAESEAEYEMFVKSRGPLHDWLKTQRDMSVCGRGTPWQLLERCGVTGPRLLAVHSNYLGPGDLELIARSGSSIVHCPRSHAWFNHRPFAARELESAGVNICLGTDSLATIRQTRGEPLELNLFEEMRVFSDRFPDATPESILKMATVNGARALGCEGELGQFTTGARADWIAIPYNGSARNAHEQILGFSGPVPAAMIDGEWAIGGEGRISSNV